MDDMADDLEFALDALLTAITPELSDGTKDVDQWRTEFVRGPVSRGFQGTSDAVVKFVGDGEPWQRPPCADASDVLPVFYTEFAGKYARRKPIVVTPTAADLRLDARKLASDISALLQPGVCASLPQMAQEDLVEAGKLIAQGHPNGAGLLLMRCAEVALRKLHENACKEVDQNCQWHAIEDNLTAAANEVKTLSSAQGTAASASAPK